MPRKTVKLGLKGLTGGSVEGLVALGLLDKECFEFAADRETSGGHRGVEGAQASVSVLPNRIIRALRQKKKRAKEFEEW